MVPRLWVPDVRQKYWMIQDDGQDRCPMSKQQQQQKMRSRQSSIHSLNNSSTKQRFTFSKSPRFGRIKVEGTDSFYNLPSIRSGRSTSFGLGSKDIGMQARKVCPSPQSYRIKSQFDNYSKYKGFSFGEGREDMEVTGPLSESLVKKFVPSPDHYYPKPISTTSYISIKSRLKDRSLEEVKKIPGPGSYKQQELGKKNYYITSGTHNRINFRICSSDRPEINLSEKREFNVKLGPGSYEAGENLNALGKYRLSKNKNTKGISFGRSPRPEPTINHILTTPGPTLYQMYSQFH